jgi:phosphoribosylglycinamide formyltransferase 1
MFLRVAVLVSGRGSNLAALLRTLGDGAPARVVLVIGNRAEAGGLDLAREHGIPVHVLNDIADSEELRRVLTAAGAELVVLAGYLKRIPAPVVREWRGRIINVHPALLPRHGGAGMYGLKVHQAVLASGDATSGATVHQVSEEYDEGEILCQGVVPVLPGDTPETLAARVLDVEHKLLPAAVLAIARGGMPASDRPEGDRMNVPGPQSPAPRS